MLTAKDKVAIHKKIKMLLHAGRDCMRNRKEDTVNVAFSCNNPYYAEAFEMMRALVILGHGKFGAINKNDNVNYWFNEICQEVLKEENFGGSNQCDICYEKYRKDTARKFRGF